MADPFTRIDYAVGQAGVITGDTLLVAPGDYPNEMIDPLGKDLLIEGTGGPGVTWVSGPTGGGDSPGAFLWLHNSESPAMVIRGITFRDYVGSFGTPQVVVGGVDVSPTFENCIFQNNDALGAQAAVHFVGGAPSFLDCQWFENTAECCGGLMGEMSDLTLQGCYFEGNELAMVVDGGSAEITDTLFAYNRSRTCLGFALATAIHANSASLTLRYVSVQGHNPFQAFPLTGRFMYFEDCQVELEDCLLRGATAFDNSGGAVAVNGGSFDCRRVHFSWGLANKGGAVSLDGCDATFIECEFFSNRGDVEDYGGGAMEYSGGGSLLVDECMFQSNKAGAGGAIAILAPLAVIRDSVFVSNAAERDLYLDGFHVRGGAIWSTHAVEIDNCEFEGNTAVSGYTSAHSFMDYAIGGALWLGGNSVVRDSSFINNHARAGNVCAGGAIWAEAGTVANGSVFYGNEAQESTTSRGGALAGAGLADRCTLVMNQAVFSGSEVHGWSLTNSVVVPISSTPFNAVPSVQYSLVVGGYLGTGNIDGDPMFWGVHDFHLQPGSPAIDAGDPGHALDPDGSVVDMGAFAYDSTYCGPACAGEIGLTYCFGNANSTGQHARCFAFGSNQVANNDLLLAVRGLPVGVFGYFLMSTQSDYVPYFGGSRGNLCIGSPLLRWNDDLEYSNLAGQVSRRLDLGNLPQGYSITPGSSWNFQLWHRDIVMGQSTSNTSSALSIYFQ